MRIGSDERIELIIGMFRSIQNLFRILIEIRWNGRRWERSKICFIEL